MADHTHDELFHRTSLLTPYVGGNIKEEEEDFRLRRVKEQQMILDRQRDLDKTGSSKLDYDYVGEYRASLGLNKGETSVKYQQHYINIDSRHRTTEPTVDKGDFHILDNNPITFVAGSNDLYFADEDHGYEVGDRITVNGVVGTHLTLRMSFKATNVNDETVDRTLLEFKTNSNLMRINTPHADMGMSATDHGSISIEGVKGNISNTYLESIPINLINNTHSIIMADPDNNTDHAAFLANDAEWISVQGNSALKMQFLMSFFFVDLGTPYSGSFIPTRYNININFLSIYSIPINEVNAEYPVSTDYVHGYHTITKIDSNGFWITIPDRTASGPGNSGGGAVTVAKINDISSGYTDPNSYTVGIESFNNVVMARLVSTEFPITEKVIRTASNNKIYWQNIDDGDHMYSIEVEAGNYNPDDLVTLMEQKFATVSRINKSEDNEYVASHTTNHFIQTNININTDEVSFRSYRQSILSKPIIGIEPDVQEDPSLDPDFDTLASNGFDIVIQHANHRLSVGSVILIKDAVSHMGIPSNRLNSEHVITEIVSADSYKIHLDRFNLVNQRYATAGGVSVIIFTPTKFRLRFDLSDTMGEILGFRNPGKETSITPFSTEIKNTDAYDSEVSKTATGIDKVITHNSISLAGDNYILMKIDQFEKSGNTFHDIGPVKSTFAKIQLSGTAGNMVFNTFVPASVIFQQPIVTLSELSISFYSPMGNLYNFNGINHSFTLEILTRKEIPIHTEISAHTGKGMVDLHKESNMVM